VGHVSRMDVGRGVYRVLVVRPVGGRRLGRPRRVWEDNIKLDLRETGIDGVNWIRLARDGVRWRAFVSTVMSSIKKAGHCLTRRVTISFSKNIVHYGVSK
jgi:hypothetical protein